MEVLQKYESFANELFVKHNITDWKFVWNNRTSNQTFGICKYKQKEIHVNRKYALIETEEEVFDTIIHEIAHALTKGAGHGEIWKAKCRELGCRDEQFANLSEDSIKKLARYKGICPTCGHEIFSSSKRTKFIHISCSNKDYENTGNPNYEKHTYIWYNNN